MEFVLKVSSLTLKNCHLEGLNFVIFAMAWSYVKISLLVYMTGRINTSLKQSTCLKLVHG